MQDFRDRLCRLIQAVRSPSGLQEIERCIQQVIQRQAATQTASQPAGAKPPPSKTGKQALDFGGDELEEWEEALELCSSILDSIEDLPDAADDFAVSVRDKTESIRDWIEEHEEVTSAQLRALENMEAGVSRWQR